MQDREEEYESANARKEISRESVSPRLLSEPVWKRFLAASLVDTLVMKTN